MSYVLSLAVFASIHVILAMAVNLSIGYAGLVSVAHGALMGVGAYAAALLALHAHINMLWSLAFGALIAGVVALVFARMSLEIQGDGYILASFAFQMVMGEIFMKWASLTGGPFGLRDIPRPALFGETLAGPTGYSAFAVAIAAVVAGLAAYVGGSPFGLAVRGLRESERVAASLGKDTRRLKVTLFTFSGALAGLAGALHASMIRFIYPGDFEFTTSVLLVAYVIVGGIGNLAGSILGVALLTALPQVLGFLPWIPVVLQGPLQQVMYGLILMAFVRLRPQGLLPEKPLFRARRHQLGVAQ